jgi:hypothetical protein
MDHTRNHEHTRIWIHMRQEAEELLILAKRRIEVLLEQKRWVA